jgi:hypothetical protein
MRVYISGPMTGIPEYNRAAFLSAEGALRSRGYDVENPWRLGAVEDWDRFDYMRRDIPAMTSCDAIYMLPGWLRSWGAKREYLVARLVFGLRRLR